MKETLEFIVKNLVENKEAVTITEEKSLIGITYYIKVDNAEIGRLIGKKGKIIQSLRTIFRAAGLKKKQNIKLEIVEENKPEEKKITEEISNL